MVSFGFISLLAARIVAFFNYRQALRTLSALDDRELGDLGICRSRIEDIARGAGR
jgi:uncharacterized protein YjiS (DUF1127 family)